MGPKAPCGAPLINAVGVFVVKGMIVVVGMKLCAAASPFIGV